MLCNKFECLDLVWSCIFLMELDIFGCRFIIDEILWVIVVCCINFEFVNLSKCFCLRGGGVNLLVMFCKRLKIFNLIRCWFFNDFNFEVFDLKKIFFDR